jgi:hypothetical protein
MRSAAFAGQGRPIGESSLDRDARSGLSGRDMSVFSIPRGVAPTETFAG